MLQVEHVTTLIAHVADTHVSPTASVTHPSYTSVKRNGAAFDDGTADVTSDRSRTSQACQLGAVRGRT